MDFGACLAIETLSMQTQVILLCRRAPAGRSHVWLDEQTSVQITRRKP